VGGWPTASCTERGPALQGLLLARDEVLPCRRRCSCLPLGSHFDWPCTACTGVHSAPELALCPLCFLAARCAVPPAAPKRPASSRPSMRRQRRLAACLVSVGHRRRCSLLCAAGSRAADELHGVGIFVWPLALELSSLHTLPWRCRAKPAAGTSAGGAVWGAGRAAGPAPPCHHQEPDCLPGLLGPPPAAVRPNLPGAAELLGRGKAPAHQQLPSFEHSCQALCVSCLPAVVDAQWAGDWRPLHA
jgi:hypothetical protein